MVHKLVAQAISNAATRVVFRLMPSAAKAAIRTTALRWKNAAETVVVRLGRTAVKDRTEIMSVTIRVREKRAVRHRLVRQCIVSRMMSVATMPVTHRFATSSTSRDYISVRGEQPPSHLPRPVHRRVTMNRSDWMSQSPLPVYQSAHPIQSLATEYTRPAICKLR